MRRKLLYAAAVVVLLVLVGVKLGFGRGTEQTGEPTLTAVQAQRGDIAVSVSGSGTVQPIEQYDVSSLVSGDILEDYVTLGAQVEAGDLLAVYTTGAYGYSMASNYNSNPIPAAVLVKEGRAEVLVRRQSYADMTALQEIPPSLR